MRLFDLFMRRAGVRPAPVRAPSSVSRLTVICMRDALSSVRKQIHHDFHAAGLRIAKLHVDAAHVDEMVRACITIDCPPEMRSVLMTQARHLWGHPGVRNVQWGDRRHIALN